MEELGAVDPLLPEDRLEGLSETCYTMEYQSARFVVLNSNEKVEQQVEWLEDVLSKNKLPWVICSFHHPIFSTAKDRDNAQLRKLWKPDPKPYMVRVAENTQLYQVIHIDGNSLRYEARTAVGDLYDGFELTKEVGGVNRMQEMEIRLPERRRIKSKSEITQASQLQVVPK